MARTTCQTPMDRGGLGVVNFEIKYKALQIKKLFQTLTNKNQKSYNVAIYNLGRHAQKIDPKLVIENSRPISQNPSPQYENALPWITEIEQSPGFSQSLTTKEIVNILTPNNNQDKVRAAWQIYTYKDYDWQQLWTILRDKKIQNKFSDILWLILH